MLKIDIEGTEYQLLEHLMKTNSLKLVDIIAIEFHERFLEVKNVELQRKEFDTYFKENNINSVPWD